MRAARAGLREGDVILAVGNTEIANVKEFEAALAKADKSKPVSRAVPPRRLGAVRADPACTLSSAHGVKWPQPAVGFGAFFWQLSRTDSSARRNFL